MGKDVSFLYDKYNIYMENADRYEKSGRIELAKRNYYNAARTLLEIAKTSTPKLKAAQLQKAKGIIAHAEGLKERPRVDGRYRGEDGEEDNGEAKDWRAADIPNVGFDDIAGLDDVKEAITIRMINPVKYPKQYAVYGKKSGGGVLLYGPPGTGKTMIAKAIAHEVGAVFYCIKSSDILSKWVGESERNINSLFEATRNVERAIIFVDEMDSLFAQRGRDIHNDKRVNEFLQQIDGFVGKNPNLLLLGATNRPWDVDPAAIRSGRFSEKIYVPLPDIKARLFMLRRYLNAPLADNIDWVALARATAGYSGADIAEICERAKNIPLMAYINTGVVAPITEEHVKKAISQVSVMVSPEEIAMYERFAGVPARSEQTDIDPREVQRLLALAQPRTSEDGD